MISLADIENRIGEQHEDSTETKVVLIGYQPREKLLESRGISNDDICRIIGYRKLIYEKYTTGIPSRKK